MKKALVLSILFIWVSYNSTNAQDWLLAKQAGSTSNDYGYGIAVDGAGNGYVIGYFRGTATFGSTSLSSSGESDIFVTKYDPSGNVVYAKKAGGTKYDFAKAITVDGSGNAYITWHFGDFWTGGTATFGSTTLTSAGKEDIFVAKYDASGNVVYAKRAGGTSPDYGYGIAVDGSGNAYVTGYFGGTATFGSTTLTSAGKEDIFVAKYDASGNVFWARSAGGTSNDYGYGIAVNGSGNAYITGEFQGTATFGSTTLNSVGSWDIYIAKYDASGNIIYTNTAGSTNTDYGRAIAVDGSGNSYITGFFNGSATFGSSTLNGIGNNDIFVAKYGQNPPVVVPQTGPTLLKIRKL